MKRNFLFVTFRVPWAKFEANPSPSEREQNPMKEADHPRLIGGSFSTPGNLFMYKTC